MTCLQVGVSLHGTYHKASLTYDEHVNHVFIRDSVSPTLELGVFGEKNQVCLHRFPSHRSKFNVDQSNFKLDKGAALVSIETNQGDLSQEFTVCYENGVRKVTIICIPS
jgi:hypothetical protein